MTDDELIGYLHLTSVHSNQEQAVHAMGLAAGTISRLLAEQERLRAAIRITASEDTYDELAIRKAVSFELAELIVDAHRALRRYPDGDSAE